MAEWPPVIALIITYERTNLALETIRSVKQRVIYPNIGWHIADDGSRPQHVERLLEEIGPTYSVTASNAKRGGVGKSMNLGMRDCLQRADLILWLEDDWVLPQELDLRPCVQLLQEHPDIGMIRLGRLTAGLKAETISGASRLWWKILKNCQTYVFSGNAALRHKRFCEAYGPYREGLRPGETELDYCARFIATAGPDIVWPASITPEMAFQHTGDHQSFKYYQESEGMTAEQAAAKFARMSGAI